MKKEKKAKKKFKITFFQDFKAFIKKGNVLDLAVALLIGSAFTAIVNSLANDVIMPPISMLLAGLGLKNLKWVIRPENAELGITEISLKYGNFLQAIINFVILALCVFVIVRIITRSGNSLKKFNSDMKKIIKDKTMSEEEKAAAKAELEAKQKAEEEAKNAPKPQTQEEILAEIRDLLKASVVNQQTADTVNAAIEQASEATQDEQ